MKAGSVKRDSVAVIDIGSNSVRLVVYESLSRSLVTTFNEKVLCGLGREVHSTKLLAPDAVTKALSALKRFRAVCKTMRVGRTFAIATAAARDASNGAQFIKAAERLCGCKILILSGAREAELSALGVISGIHKPDGLVGDLGGGSLELVEVKSNKVHKGVTLPLGSLALQDASKKSATLAQKIVKTALADVSQLAVAEGRTFYAVGGTWRALARLHIIQSNYPLRVMHGYTLPAAEVLAFTRRLRRLALTNTLADIDAVAEARQPLLVYAALVLEHIIRIAKPKNVVFSTYGVREGVLFEKLPTTQRAQDGIICSAQILNQLLSRSSKHAEELIGWSGILLKKGGVVETDADKRMRHTACLLSDVGWRGHPDYRGEQAMNLIANGNFGSINHNDRAFLALTVFHRYEGSDDGGSITATLRELLTPAQVERARLLGTAFRVAHLISAAQPGILPAVHFRAAERKLIMVFEHRMVDLVGDRVGSRFKQLARMMGRSGSIILQ